MQLWQQPYVWESWLRTVLAWAGKELPTVEVVVPQVSFPVLVCRPHVGVSKFEQRNRWAQLLAFVLSTHTHNFIPFLLT